CPGRPAPPIPGGDGSGPAVWRRSPRGRRWRRTAWPWWSWCPDRRRGSQRVPGYPGNVLRTEPEVVKQPVGAAGGGELGEPDSDHLGTDPELCHHLSHGGGEPAGDVGLLGHDDRLGLLGGSDDRLAV